MTHTLGPLHLRDGAIDGQVHICAPGKTVAVCEALPPEVCEANAERLVACWNFCEGVDNDALEENTLANMYTQSAGDNAKAMAVKFRDQRDALLEALEKIEQRRYAKDASQSANIAKAAISKES